MEFLGAYEAQAEESYFDPAKRAAIAEVQREPIVNNSKLKGSLLDVGSGTGGIINSVSPQLV